MIKYPGKSNLKKKGFFLDHDLKLGSCSHCIPNEEVGREEWGLRCLPQPHPPSSLTHSLISVRNWFHPQWVDLPTSINPIKIIPHRHAQRFNVEGHKQFGNSKRSQMHINQEQIQNQVCHDYVMFLTSLGCAAFHSTTAAF